MPVALTEKLTAAPTATLAEIGCNVMDGAMLAGGDSTVRLAGLLRMLPALFETSTV